LPCSEAIIRTEMPLLFVVLTFAPFATNNFAAATSLFSIA
jgi:hypothetical protein